MGYEISFDDMIGRTWLSLSMRWAKFESLLTPKVCARTNLEPKWKKGASGDQVHDSYFVGSGNCLDRLCSDRPGQYQEADARTKARACVAGTAAPSLNGNQAESDRSANRFAAWKSWLQAGTAELEDQGTAVAQVIACR
jgi:hypothetical protein